MKHDILAPAFLMPDLHDPVRDHAFRRQGQGEGPSIQVDKGVNTQG